MDMATIIRTARGKRDAIRLLADLISDARIAGHKHAEILRQINAAGWPTRFGEPLDLSRYHIERSTVKCGVSTRDQMSNGVQPVIKRTAVPQVGPGIDVKNVRLTTPASISRQKQTVYPPTRVRNHFEKAFEDTLPEEPIISKGENE